MQEYHLLKVENSADSRTYHLNAATIVIGRNTLSDICVDDDQVMTHHALMRRIPSLGARDAFVFIARAGNIEVQEKGAWVKSNEFNKTLVTGDSFRIGDTRFSYIMAYMSETDYARRFKVQPVAIMPIKRKILVA